MAKRKPKLSKVVKLEVKLSNQAKSIKQLTEAYFIAIKDVEVLENKICAYMESASFYKAENEDLRAKYKELERAVKRKEVAINYRNEAISNLLGQKGALETERGKYQETITSLQTGKQKAEEIQKDYFNALVVKEDECRRLRAELEQAKKPFWKKVLNIG